MASDLEQCHSCGAARRYCGCGRPRPSNLITMSKVEVAVGYDDVSEAGKLLVERAFEKVEAIVRELERDLEVEAETKLVRRKYNLDIEWKQGAKEALQFLDMFDINLTPVSEERDQ